jgi:hypothetical protein
MLELLLMHINRHARVAEVFEAARMIEVQMAHNDRLDILDVVARALDCCGKVVEFLVPGSGEEVCGYWAPLLYNKYDYYLLRKRG